jgi:two-component system sensor histidine kinase KdpD
MARSARHKVFLGMAAGVGKTYRMLQEGNAEAENGRDVVIGYLEPHGRAETEAQARGLERLPRRRVVHRDLSMDEMDLPAVLARAPELCLIDELAHTNAPGVEHGKRYEDVADVLAAGIDVFSTVNIQHLESLNDQVAELTGVHVRETFPDRVLVEADEVVMIDLTPEALLLRLREGKVYPLERLDSALNNFFKIENLQALRETALRQVAEAVGENRLTREVVGTRDDMAAGMSQAVGERLLVMFEPGPSAQRLVRRAWRSSRRLGAPIDLLWVQRPGRELTPDEDDGLTAIRRLAGVLGVSVLVEEGDDLAETVARVAKDRGTTYLLLGRPEVRRGFDRLGESLPEKLTKRLPGVDIRLVAERSTEDRP